MRGDHGDRRRRRGKISRLLGAFSSRVFRLGSVGYGHVFVNRDRLFSGVRGRGSFGRGGISVLAFRVHMAVGSGFDGRAVRGEMSG